MNQSPSLTAMTEPRRAILTALKERGSLGIVALSERIGITYEGIRQHLTQLQEDGWISRRLRRDGAGPGRPRSVYHLTTAGEHLFPKEYDQLAVALIDAAADRLGPEAVQQLLEEVARRKVEQWEPQVRGKPLQGKLRALESIYVEGDPYCQVEAGEDGTPRLVEMNCPFLEVARRRPALCSVTVSVLRRLLGYEVVRSERFQRGDGRCVFRVLEDRPVEPERPLFEWEPEAETCAGGS